MLIDLAENLFTHMRMIRRKTIGEMDRADRSIRDHMNIIEASRRATPRAPRRWCAIMRSVSPSTLRNMRIIWIDNTQGDLPWPMQQQKEKPRSRKSEPNAEQELTDGFHLVIDALKLNGITTIYGVPGIPITDFGPHGAGRGHARHLVPP